MIYTYKYTSWGKCRTIDCQSAWYIQFPPGTKWLKDTASVMPEIRSRIKPNTYLIRVTTVRKRRNEICFIIPITLVYKPCRMDILMHTFDVMFIGKRLFYIWSRSKLQRNSTYHLVGNILTWYIIPASNKLSSLVCVTMPSNYITLRMLLVGL